MTLYQLTGEFLELRDLLEDEDTPEEAVKDTLGMILADIDDKAEGYYMVIKQFQADAAEIKAKEDILNEEVKRLRGKRQSLERRVDQMRSALLSAMLLTGKKQIKRPLFTISTRTVQKIFLDVPEEDVPDEFQVITRKVDKRAIETFMKQNALSATSFAHWEPVDSLTVR